VVVVGCDATDTVLEAIGGSVLIGGSCADCTGHRMIELALRYGTMNSRASDSS